VEFLVEIAVELPATLAPDRRAELLAAELEAGRRLRHESVIDRIWRLPGRLANVGIWRASSATELDERIRSLPLSPFMTVAVTALATHPIEEPGADG
jgi:muconolactone D-isomerase